MRTIAIVNQKGGCGKTTCAINLAAIYAKRGLRTLLVDMDPQSHCAAGLGVPESRIEYSIGDALISDIDGRFNPDDLRWEVTRNLDLAPSTMRLAGMEAPGGGLHELPDKDKRLEKLLKRMDDRYDLCLVDCPPTIGLLAFNALRAARETLIPVETGYYSLIGAEKQWKTIQRIIERIGRPIACHMVATMYDEKSDVGKNILTTLRRRFAGQLLPTVIRLSETIREAACLGQPVIDYAPNSEAKQDFVKLADWLEQHACPARGQFTPAWEQRSFSSRQNISFHRRSVQSIAPESTPRIGGAGDRAAELVQRVQELNRRNRVSKAEGTQTQSPQMPLSISPKTTPHPVPEASPDSAIDTSSRELDHHSVEFKPEVA
ncbi:MAG: ParA family protein, partial [Planctomycetota bacterium]|nr:ParA family protein [Planctomycetota bacterium]